MNTKKSIIIAVTAYMLLLAVSFMLSIVAGLGEAESRHDPSSVLLYVRRGLLVLLALLLPVLSGQRGPLTTSGWKVSPAWYGVAVALGFLIGYGNRGGFNPLHASALILACFHAFAAELFFRAYLIQTFSRHMKGFWLPVIIPAVFYGVYYLSVWTLWQQPGAGKLVFVGLFTGLGIVFGFCYKKSGGFPIPWLMHFLGVLQYSVFFN